MDNIGKMKNKKKKEAVNLQETQSCRTEGKN